MSISKSTYSKLFLSIENTELLKQYFSLHINNINIIDKKQKDFHIENFPIIDENLDPKEKIKIYIQYLKGIEDTQSIDDGVQKIVSISNPKYREIINNFIKSKQDNPIYSLLDDKDAFVEGLLTIYLQDLEAFNDLYVIANIAKVNSWKSYPIKDFQEKDFKDKMAPNINVNHDAIFTFKNMLEAGSVLFKALGEKTDSLYMKIIEGVDRDYVYVKGVRFSERLDNENHEKGDKKKNGKDNLDKVDLDFEIKKDDIFVVILKTRGEVMLKSKLKTQESFDLASLIAKSVYNIEIEYKKRKIDISQFKYKSNSPNIVNSNGYVQGWYLVGIGLSYQSNDVVVEGKKKMVADRKISFAFKKSQDEPQTIKLWSSVEALGMSTDFSGYEVDRVLLKFTIIENGKNKDLNIKIDKNSFNINNLYKSGNVIERCLLDASVLGDWEEIEV